MKSQYFETLKEAKAIDDHRVAVVFRKGRKGVFDCAPYFGMGYYRKLNDPKFFKSAFVSCGDLAWPGDIDIGADDVWDEAIPAPSKTRRKTAKSAKKKARA